MDEFNNFSLDWTNMGTTSFGFDEVSSFGFDEVSGNGISCEANEDKADKFSDTCAEYRDHLDWCGNVAYNTDDFNSARDCCACNDNNGEGPQGTYSADAAYQICGSQEDYDRVMNVQTYLERRGELARIHTEIAEEGPQGTTSADAAYQLRASQEDYDRVMNV